MEDHCAAVHLLVDQGQPGEIYNIGANAQLSNIELTRTDPRLHGQGRVLDRTGAGPSRP